MVTVAWFIPRLAAGSGGLNTVFRLAHTLMIHGYDIHLFVDSPGSSSAKVRNQIWSNYGYNFPNLCADWNSSSTIKVDVAIATMWHSAHFVASMPEDILKIYFIQDDERLFYPASTDYLFAENSYRLGLKPIFLGKWVAKRLGSELGIHGPIINFGVDSSIYKPLPSIKVPNSICFLSQPEKPRRCTSLGLDALKIVKANRPDVNIYIYGSDFNSRKSRNFNFVNLGLISTFECNQLYNLCTIGLSISASNPSRVPFEMISAGLQVVEIDKCNVARDLPSKCVTLSEESPQKLAQTMIRLLDEQETFVNNSEPGRTFASEYSIDAENNQFLNAFKHIYDEYKLSGTINEINMEYISLKFDKSSKSIFSLFKMVIFEIMRKIYRPIKRFYFQYLVG